MTTSPPQARRSAVAAVVLHRAGRDPGWIATRLGLQDLQVRRWLERAQAGKSVEPASGMAVRALQDDGKLRVEPTGRLTKTIFAGYKR